MNILIFVTVFLLGTIIGSFLNVVIFRFNTSRSISKGRSICMTCSKTLRWYELIPVISWLFQLGRCRGCATKISHQYPLVEVITGVIFLLLSIRLFPTLAISSNTFIFLLSFYAMIFCLLIVLAVYDIRHKIVPDTLVYTFAGLALFSTFVMITNTGIGFHIPSLNVLAIGPLLAVPFALIWLLSKGRLMGLGDAKIILGIGWLFGLSKGIAVLVVAFWIGAIVSILVLLLSHLKINMKTEIPFAPFLILGILVVLLTGIDIFSLAQLFSF